MDRLAYTFLVSPPSDIDILKLPRNKKRGLLVILLIFVQQKMPHSALVKYGQPGQDFPCQKCLFIVKRLSFKCHAAPLNLVYTKFKEKQHGNVSED